MSFVKTSTTNEEEHGIEKVPCKVVNNNNISDLEIHNIMMTVSLIEFNILYKIIDAIEVEIIEYFKDFPSKVRSKAKNADYRLEDVEESEIMDYKLDIPDKIPKGFVKALRNIYLRKYAFYIKRPMVASWLSRVYKSMIIPEESTSEILTNTFNNAYIMKISPCISNTCIELYFAKRKGVDYIVRKQNKGKDNDIIRWWDSLVCKMVYDFQEHIICVINKFKRTPCRQILII